MLLSELFDNRTLSKSDVFGFRADLDAVGLKTMFNRVAQNYCVRILEKSEDECSEDLKGCGLNDNCPFGSVCKNNASSPNGYDCFGMQL